MNYPWWDLEGCELLGLLLYEGGEGYAGAVNQRFNNLEQSIIALRPIVQMLGVSSFPIPSAVRPIDRYVWLRAIIDLAFFRFSVIRDNCFFLVSEVFKLKLNPFQMSLGNLKKQKELYGTQVLNILEEISLIGKSFRVERNKRAHQGIQREIGNNEFDTLIFKVAAMTEEMGRGQVENYSLDGEYNKQVSLLHNVYVAEVEALLNKVRELQDCLVEPFSYRLKKASQKKQTQRALHKKSQISKK
jgi:hypothetical protein